MPLHSHAGTPILFSKNVSATLYNHELVKPDLINFAKGNFITYNFKHIKEILIFLIKN